MSPKKNGWHQEFLNYLGENISDLGALLIVDNQGKILVHEISSDFKKEYDFVWLKNIAKKVSIRFKIKEFHKEMEGLQLTINVFKNYALVVRPLNSTFLLMIVSSSQSTLPKWIKNNTQWWVDELIFEDHFINELENL